MPRSYELVICGKEISAGESGRICLTIRKTLSSEAQGLPYLADSEKLKSLLTDDRYYGGGSRPSALPAGCYVSTVLIEEKIELNNGGSRDGYVSMSETFVVRSASFPPPPMPVAVTAAPSTEEAEEED